MSAHTRTIVFALLLAAGCLAIHPSQSFAMGMDDDGTDLDDGYYQNGKWHPPEDEDQDRRRLFKKKHRQSPSAE
ncbi:hypothetical protein [Methyloligella solikamskensis]|uniref:Secreted protein n=1 Tax=Methyloligella solikamskensis TaxID=1177756 RepID=A0ABW3J7B6_9HYPH